MSLFKSWLLGQSVTFGYKAHNNFGRAVHELFLLNRPGRYKLTKEEIKNRKGMVEALNSHPVVKRIMLACPIREKRRPATLNGVKIKFTPDAHGKKIMSDLKTTVCTNLEKFRECCMSYGYVRQGRAYGIALGIYEYWIIGIQKTSPYKVFLVPIHESKDWINYADAELSFLLYFYKNYGKPNFKRKRPSGSS